eukprot:9460614-Alexandrium_andersonii.AAC.1
MSFAQGSPAAILPASWARRCRPRWTAVARCPGGRRAFGHLPSGLCWYPCRGARRVAGGGSGA